MSDWLGPYASILHDPVLGTNIMGESARVTLDGTTSAHVMILLGSKITRVFPEYQQKGGPVPQPDMYIPGVSALPA